MTVTVDLETITSDTAAVVAALLEEPSLRSGQILVVGCSTSEILGRPIGRSPDLGVARAVLRGLTSSLASPNDLFLAIQCCQHLNRSLVIERDCAERYDLDVVTVIPAPHAGGPLATVAYESFRDPVVVERIQGHAAIDIGDTFVSMHLRPVVVPVRTPTDSIGSAHVTLARTRPKLIGGGRARYPEDAL